MQFHPLHNRVGIKRIDAEEKPAGGIIIPDTAKEKPPQGENNTNHSAPALAYQPKRLEKLASIAVVRKCHRGQEICSQGQPAEYWYRVTSGTARRCVAQPDGRRQIVELLLPGDFFGFTALTEYDSTVEAVVEGTIVASYPRRRVEMLAEADPQLSREILQVTFEALSRLQAQLMILGRITATEKVSSFLLKMAGRLSDQNSRSCRFADIALRHRRLSRLVGRNGQSLAHIAQELRPDCALRAPFGENHRSGCP